MTGWTDLLLSAQAVQRAGRLDEAEGLYRQAIEAAPQEAAAHHLFGLLRMEQRRFEDAEKLLRAACRRTPHPPEALLHHALSLAALSRFEDALAVLDALLAQRPDAAGAWNNRAEIFVALGKPEQALADFQKALTIDPRLAQSWEGQGRILLGLNSLHEALDSFDRALAIQPQRIGALFGRARALTGLRRPGEALPILDRISSLMPDNPDLWFHRGIALDDLGYFEDAIGSYDRAIALRPQGLGARNNRGVVLQRLGRYGEAAQGYRDILARAPDSDLAVNGLANCALYACDWSQSESLARRMRTHIEAGGRIQLGTVLGHFSDPALHLAAARNYVKEILPGKTPSLWRGPRFSGKRIRLAYCSANFNSHPVPRFLAETFEGHDRSDFEVLAISFGVDDKSDMRQRLLRAFDQFHDVAQKSDADIARLMAELGVDIAVDLMGHTNHSRPAVFAARPAPVQVNYLGFPGTLGADFYDYIIGDEIILPLEHQRFYAEKIVQLPGSYMANACGRVLPSETPSRETAGLPEKGFVFCCFNSVWKITPHVFAVWMRLLDAVPGSLLWLRDGNSEAVAHLRSEARARGIAQNRLVFAPHVSSADHMARHCLADLFLDTLPYNAHSTASDSLWAGVPLISVKGDAFHSRVAASLLSAVGMAELIAGDLAEYESLALALAQNPTRLRQLRRRLADSRTGGLFANAAFTRKLEAAYRRMGELFRNAQSPRALEAAEIEGTLRAP